MKKFKLILPAIIILMILTGCSKKSAITPDEFTNIMNENGYSVVFDEENRNHILNTGEYRYFRNEEIYIDYYSNITKELAEKSFIDYESIFKDEREGGSETTVNTSNYSKYIADGDEYYVAVIRVEDTLLIVRTAAYNKQEAKDIIKTLNY